MIYIVQCNRCNLQYIGETKRRLKDRFNEHRRAVDKTNIKSKPTTVMHLSMLCRRGEGEAGMGLGHLTDLVEVGSKLTTLFIYFFHSQNQRAKAGSMAFRSRNFHAMYLAAGSFVFA